jgi:hypothetical protein
MNFNKIGSGHATSTTNLQEENSFGMTGSSVKKKLRFNPILHKIKVNQLFNTVLCNILKYLAILIYSYNAYCVHVAFQMTEHYMSLQYSNTFRP